MSPSPAQVDPSNTLVVAVDPGKVTGIAVWDPAELGNRPGAYEVPSRVKVYRVFDDIVSWGRPGTVVIERFTIKPGVVNTNQPDALMIIGAIESTATRVGWPVEFQLPAAAMSWATNERLRRVGWWVRGKEHANDALRHLLLWTYAHNLLPEEIKEVVRGG